MDGNGFRFFFASHLTQPRRSSALQPPFASVSWIMRLLLSWLALIQCCVARDTYYNLKMKDIFTVHRNCEGSDRDMDALLLDTVALNRAGIEALTHLKHNTRDAFPEDAQRTRGAVARHEAMAGWKHNVRLYNAHWWFGTSLPSTGPLLDELLKKGFERPDLDKIESKLRVMQDVERFLNNQGWKPDSKSSERPHGSWPDLIQSVDRSLIHQVLLQYQGSSANDPMTSHTSG